MKKILVTSTDLMMVQFLVPHISFLSENGYEIEIACSNVGNRMDEIYQKLENVTSKIHTVRLHRSPLSLDNVNGYRDMEKIISNGQYDIIWTNEPVMGVVTRLAANNARRTGTKVVYMVHGFHFYKGAPLLNWLVYYPIEKTMSSKADAICTVNTEDYNRAKSFRAKKVEYIHGIGINTGRLSVGNKNDIRNELGLRDNDFLVLSVGELNENKNQKTIISALAVIKDPTIHYVLCGKGDQSDKLKKQVKELGLGQNVHFLGYRTDVVDICKQADVYVMPSKREGLPVASLEAMYCGLPVLTSNIRGLSDVVEEGMSGYMYNPDDVNGFAKGILKLKNDPQLRQKMGLHNKEAVRPFCIENTKVEVLNLINTL